MPSFEFDYDDPTSIDARFFLLIDWSRNDAGRVSVSCGQSQLAPSSVTTNDVPSSDFSPGQFDFDLPPQVDANKESEIENAIRTEVRTRLSAWMRERVTVQGRS